MSDLLAARAWESRYAAIRRHYLDDPLKLVEIEREVAQLLLAATLDSAEAIERSFLTSAQLTRSWIENQPKPRGRKPRGDSVPWQEVAEQAVLPNLVVQLHQRVPGCEFPGLPFGGDLRVASREWLLHLDAKATGPNDEKHKIVVSPYQLSGDGLLARARYGPAVANSLIEFPMSRSPQQSKRYHPRLSPLYLTEDGGCRVCVSAFIKINYGVASPGQQALESLELAVVPSGLLLFGDNGTETLSDDLPLNPQPGFYDRSGLFAPGKDDRTVAESDRRVRVLLDRLAQLDRWRVVKLSRASEGWQTRYRADAYEATPR